MKRPWPTRTRERELDREIQDHLDLEGEVQQRAGLSDGEATRAARHLFGNPAIVREDVRESWGGLWLERLWIDARLAVRLWARTPGFSAIAIATIGLGIGASTALVGQINAVFWTPLPVSAPQDLRLLAWTSPRHPFVLGPNVMAGPRINGADTFATFSYPAYVAMRDEATAFADVACWADLGEARPVILGELGFGTVQFVSGNYFRTLGVRAALGRTIQPDDESAAAWSPVVMISHRFWQRTFGSVSDVISRTLRMNGRTFTIVGIMPEGFFGLDPSTSPDIVALNGAVEIAAATQNPLQNRGLWNPCRIVARVAPGRGDQEERIDLERILATFIAASPPSEPYDPPRVWLLPAAYGLSTLRDGTATPLLVLVVVVGGLLLAACANIAGLLLARGSARSREIATRLALVERRLRRERLLSSLLALFAAVTMFICCMGIYGLLAYAVERRRQEISVRMAIGARPADVVRLMMRESVLPVAVGIAVGAALSMVASRWTSTMLYGVSAYDPVTMLGTAVLFLLVAVAAAALPSRVAARVNPVLALRQ